MIASFLSVSHPVIVTAGGIVYIPQYLVACAVACYAPGLLTMKSVTSADVLQSRQDLELGAIQQLLESLQHALLDELVGPPGNPTAGPMTHQADNGSMTQQVRL